MSNRPNPDCTIEDCPFDRKDIKDWMEEGEDTDNPTGKGLADMGGGGCGGCTMSHHVFSPNTWQALNKYLYLVLIGGFLLYLLLGIL